MAKNFLIIVDFDNLSLKTSIMNKEIILFSKSKALLLKSVPSTYFEDYNGIIISSLEIHKSDNLILINRSNYENEFIIKSYFDGKLDNLNLTYYIIILDLEREILITLGNFYFYNQPYRNQFFIFSDFELFYKLSDFTINEKNVKEFIEFGKIDIQEFENKILLFDLDKRVINIIDLKALNRKNITLDLSNIKLPEKFYYFVDIKEISIVEKFKDEKLPIKITSLYQFESLLNKEMSIDFEYLAKGKVNLRSLIVSNFESFYNAYKFFKLKNWLFDFIFNPIIIYRAFILYSIIRHFRL